MYVKKKDVSIFFLPLDIHSQNSFFLIICDNRMIFNKGFWGLREENGIFRGLPVFISTKNVF